MKLRLLLILLLSNLNNLYSQDLILQKCHGGFNQDYATTLFQNTDDTFTVFGGTKSSNGDLTTTNIGYDAWLYKTDADGNIIQQKNFVDAGDQVISCVNKTADNGYILCGYISLNLNVPQLDYWIVKLDSEGEIEWQKSFGGTNYDTATSIKQLSDNSGYIVCGYTASNDGEVTYNHGLDDYWVLKLDNSGNIIWQKTYGGSNHDRALDIITLPDGNFIISGFTSSVNFDVTNNHGNFDFWILKINSDGAIIWQKTFGGTQEETNNNKLLLLDDGSLLIAGRTKSNDGDVTEFQGICDGWLIKIDTDGTLLWQKTFGGTDFDDLNYIEQTNDDGFVISGRSLSNDGDLNQNQGDFDAWIIKTDDQGQIQWQKTFGGSNYDAFKAQQIDEENYVFIGGTFSNDGDVSGNHGDSDIWFGKINISNLAIEENNPTNSSLTIAPNPATNYFTIDLLGDFYKLKSCAIFDLHGKKVKEVNTTITNKINIENLATGNYIIQIETEKGEMIYKKLIKK